MIAATLVSIGLSLGLFRCGSDGVGQEGDEPTQGVITTVEEVAAGDFKIASEEVVPSPEDSRIIVNELSGASDTFTLAEARQIQETSSDTSRVRRPFRSAMLGYWGFMMLNRVGSRPSAGAYTSNTAYQRATSQTGSSLTRTARSRSGFGSGSSTRSFGG